MDSNCPSDTKPNACKLYPNSSETFQATATAISYGFRRNEHVDKLAKQALATSLDEQIKVPIDFTDAKQRMKQRTNPRKILEKLTDSLGVQLSASKAEFALAQFYVGHTSKLHPVASYMDGRTCYCPYECKPRVINDVEHFVLRCPARASSRRSQLPAVTERRGMNVADIVRKWREKLLAFLGSEGFFIDTLAHCRN